MEGYQSEPSRTDLLNLKVLRPEILDDFLVGFSGLRDRRPEPVEYTLDRELLHRVCQMGSTTQGGSHVQSPPSVYKITARNSKIWLAVAPLSLSFFAPGSFAEIQ